MTTTPRELDDLILAMKCAHASEDFRALICREHRIPFGSILAHLERLKSLEAAPAAAGEGEARELTDADHPREKERAAFVCGYKIGYAQPGGFKPAEIHASAVRFADIEYPFDGSPQPAPDLCLQCETYHDSLECPPKQPAPAVMNSWNDLDERVRDARRRVSEERLAELINGCAPYCMKLKYGECTTLACLERDAYGRAVLPVKLLGCEALHTDSALRELQRLRERVRTLEADARRYRWHRGEQFQGDMSEQARRAAYAMYDAKLDEEMRPSGEPERSAEAAPKCETCDEGMVRCTKPGCPCGGDGCDPCPDCEKGGQK
jgi:hypothetical protein